MSSDDAAPDEDGIDQAEPDAVIRGASAAGGPQPDRYPCPCCDFWTLPEQSPGSLEICHVCFWQDDMVGFNQPDAAVGPNSVSLEVARKNYARYGACEQDFVSSVRKPRPEEYPPASNAGSIVVE